MKTAIMGWWEERKRTIWLILGLILVTQLFCKPVLVNGVSMYPTFHDRDYLFMTRVSSIDRGDIVVFRSPLPDHPLLIKRVIGKGGDHILIRDGSVYVNGKKQPWDVPTWGEVDVKVKQGTYFVLGDNRLNSLDSRSPDVGLVTKEELVGEVWMRLYPLTFY
ncbi:signal peptidase I [Geobacillus subterraneus]|uniref:Signal peptidase I n=1 Tax=Geobacillus subterraneus TaxID=129338 RepID=A0A679FQP1_9BACL|nr:signal peptidase I [Geobacillus subterraneus]BBW98972.1 signal peptidase I [Geobacillus subterraneus]